MKKVGSGQRYGWNSADSSCAHGYALPVLLDMLPVPPASVLDLGCGNGYTAGVLAGRGYTVTGVEPSVDGFEIAKERWPTVRFIQASIYDDLSNLLAEEYEIVLATEVIEHLYAPRELLKSALKLLKPDGTMILTTPYHGYVKNVALALSGRLDAHFTVGWDGGHIKFFSQRTLRLMVEEAGFARVEFRFAGRLPFLWKAMLVRARRPRDNRDRQRRE